MGQAVSKKTLAFGVTFFLLFCIVTGFGGIWLLATKMGAVSLDVEEPESQLEPQHIPEAGLAPSPDLDLNSLNFVGSFLEGQGYIVAGTVDQGDGSYREYILVPTGLDQDFEEMITLFETRLWNQSRLGFRTTLTRPGTARIKWGPAGYTYDLVLRTLTPASYWKAEKDNRPKLALVIDDWGHSPAYAAAFLNYPFPLTTAILPFLAQSAKLAGLALAAGHEVILHQPMEPLDQSLDVGQGGITSGMLKAEIEERLEQNLAHLPMVVGVNNHMGSKVTEEAETMEIVLAVLKEQGLYFLDSSTTAQSVVNQVAQDVGIPYAINNLFIDNVNEVEIVKQELRKAVQRAQKFGSAVAIGHIRETTGLALWEMIPEFMAAGIQLVPVSGLLIQPETSL